MKFTTTIFQIGNNTGIEVPAEVIESLGASKRPPVKVTVNGYSYRSTVAVMDGKFLIPLSAEHRRNSQVQGGEVHEITLELDTDPREVVLPEDMRLKLLENPEADAFYQSLVPSLKKKAFLLIEAAKTEATRTKRIAKIVEDLAQKKKP
jgi:antitoxin component of MazEF toxin-antitoxin module